MSYQSIYRGEVALCALAIVASLAMAYQPGTPPPRQTRLMAATSIADPKADAAEIDRRAQEQLKSDKKADAKTWLKSDKHVVWKWDRADAGKAVDELLKLGATKVWIVDINQTNDTEVASTFVVELPAKDKAAVRQAVFAWIEKWEDKADFDENQRAHDVGQKYWVLDTDL